MTSNSLRRASPKTWCGSPWASKTWKISSGTWTRPSQPRRPHERRGRQHVAGAWHALRHHRPAAPAHSETIQAHRHSGAPGDSLPPQPFCRAVYEGGGLRDFSSQSARDGDPGPPLLCDAGRSASAARDRGYLPRVIRGAVHCGRSHRRRGQGRLDAAWRDPRAGRRARAGGGPRGGDGPLRQDRARPFFRRPEHAGAERGRALGEEARRLDGPKRLRATKVCMDKVIRTYSSLTAMKADELRDWQQLPARTHARSTGHYACGLPDEGLYTGCSTTSKNSCPPSIP